ncbi:beta family protein [Pseudorhodoferax sp. LjRoot39]|uniref:beta family protein n=1 Tax=Pseudorhodoferax sp. LjRoot39 TaxID=3342328 RepID=UPI003ECCD41C
MTEWKYLPILKWKQGERIALRHLQPAQLEGLTPLIELLPISAAPNFASLQTALTTYVDKIANDMRKDLPEGAPFACDTRYVSTGYPKQVPLLNAVCTRLAKVTERPVLPVITSALVQSEGDQLYRLAERFEECIVRIDTPNVVAAQVQPIIEIVKEAFNNKGVHVVIDQFSLVGKESMVMAAMVQPYLDEALASNSASVTVAGGSFPVNLIGFKQGSFDIDRVEWKVWKQIRRGGSYSTVRYSDYSVTHPALAPDMDPRQTNPSVAIRYAADGHWRLFKAGGFKKGAPDQYRALCQLLLGDAVYSGPTFSHGDKWYDDAASARLGNGNPSSWRRDATNHHLVLTQRAL